MKCKECGQEFRKRRGVYMPNQLTHRQAEIVALLLQGLKNREIGEKLFVSEKTIKFHLGFIYRKLGVKNRAALISEWHRGILPKESIVLVHQFYQDTPPIRYEETDQERSLPHGKENI